MEFILNDSFQSLEINELENIDGGDLSKSSTWGAYADLAIGAFGKTTFSGFFTNTSLSYADSGCNPANRDRIY